MTQLSRRQFLKWIAAVSAAASTGLLVQGCGSEQGALSNPVQSPQPVLSDTSTPVSSPTVMPVSEGIDATSTASPPWLPSQQVASGKVQDYDLARIRETLALMLDSLGGGETIIPYGGVVVIKVNLTGGVDQFDMGGLAAEETVATHPLVVQALGELLLDAGAGELVIAEAVYDDRSFAAWGYEQAASALNARLVNLNLPDPYPDFVEVPVPDGLVYPTFMLNRSLVDCDTFISVSKMKCHVDCGVTHTMKNLVGIAPAHLYTRQPGDWWRSAFHGEPGETLTRLPRVVIDLNRSRPIHLGIVDGIKTIEAGENSNARGARQVAPGVLLAGKNAVSVDSIATAAMGFDPAADNPQVPFLRTVNHLNLANSIGLGSNRLDQIEVLGPALSELVVPFAPAVGYVWEES